MRDYEFIFWFTNGHFQRMVSGVPDGSDIMSSINLAIERGYADFFDGDDHTIINMHNVTKVEIRPAEDNSHA